jgi:hypothetical protein
MASILTSFLALVFSGTRQSIANTIQHGTTLKAEVPGNPDDTLLLFLALICSRLTTAPG